MTRPRSRCALLVLVLAGVALVPPLVAYRGEVRERLETSWLASSLARAAPSERRSRALELSRSPAGLRALESIAFSPDGAPLTSSVQDLRDLAYMAIGTECDRIRKTGARVPPDLLVRVLLETDGLNETVFDHFGLGDWLKSPDLEARRAIIDGCAELVLRPGYDHPKQDAVEFLRREGSPRAMAGFRRGALAGDHGTRHYAMLCTSFIEFQDRPSPPLGRDDHAMLRRALADPVEDVRVGAAAALACEFQDATGIEVLVAALREPPGLEGYVVLDGLNALTDRRAVEPLVRWNVTDQDASQRDDVLAKTTGHTLGPGESWASWLASHRSELPAQLDPKALAVGPLHVSPGE